MFAYRVALALWFVSVGTATAVSPGKTLEFKDGSAGKVVFSGKTHADAGERCRDCHPGIFQMRKGSVRITMAEMNAGKNCGMCHNGTKAFKSGEPANCKRCHKPERRKRNWEEWLLSVRGDKNLPLDNDDRACLAANLRFHRVICRQIFGIRLA